MKKYSDKNIFELMKIPTNELKELSVEKFIKKIVGKKVSVIPSSNNGDLVISVTSADISIRDRKIVFKDYPHFQIELAEKLYLVSIHMEIMRTIRLNLKVIILIYYLLSLGGIIKLIRRSGYIWQDRK